MSNHKCPVPKFDGKIIIKATRSVAKITVLEELNAARAPENVRQKSNIEQYGQFTNTTESFGGNPGHAQSQPANLLDL